MDPQTLLQIAGIAVSVGITVIGAVWRLVASLDKKMTRVEERLGFLGEKFEDYKESNEQAHTEMREEIHRNYTDLREEMHRENDEIKEELHRVWDYKK